MAVTISRIDAEVLAVLALDDLRGYATRHPEAHAAYLKIKSKKTEKSIAGKRRCSKKGGKTE